MIKSIVTSLALVLIVMVLAFATESKAESKIVNGGVIHFRGQIVEGAEFNIKTNEPVNTEGTIHSTTTQPVMQDGVKVGEIVTVTWN